ncbi:hypothetical protein BJF79_43635 [Actinomadura sp. CNU-125]|uniref:anthrone oxygenase family protein n=1 Tax=Actinomadura sp. CNU-125 TaxID=1904961 RepID=UPI00095D409B|nr:DUF1772 domain-containing protein [Actinomadura sp. CNU-125]OLT26332.1 hypothetical protein BJF79_43635 [Actinomadura sp. CNU-125]
MTDVLGTAVLIGSGLIAGVLFAVALSTVPALMAMPPDRYIYTHKLLGRNWDPTMPIIVLGSTVLDGTLAVVADGAARWAFLAAAALLFAVSVVSHLCNVPINKQMRVLDPDAMPAEWSDPRPRWRSWHLLRTSLAIGALGLNSIALALV